MTTLDPDLAVDLALAARLVTDGGKLAARMRTQGLSVSTKTSISDVVSDADKAAEELIAGGLVEHRPADGVLGEEGADRPGRRMWIIDPVDGTYNFVSGLPAWCTALALRDGSDLLLGAIYQATTDELWLGGKGLPLTRNGQELPFLVDRPLSAVSLSTYLNPSRLADPTITQPLLRTISGAASLRMIGSGSVELAAVAAGRIGAYLHADTLPWDWYPGAALVLSAGGVAEVVETGGHRWHLAGPRQVVQELIDLLS